MIEWPKLAKPKSIRCPYCVDGENFKLMVAQTGGDWFLCGRCGHLALPSSPAFRCLCKKCIALNPETRSTVP